MPAATYLDLIDEDRQEDRGHAATPRGRSKRPPHAPSGTPHKRAIDRDLAKHYEACKRDPRVRARYKGRRRKEYCAAVAHTIVNRKHGKEDEETMSKKKKGKRRMPPRYKSGPHKGQFKPRGASADETPRRRSSGKRKSSGKRRSSEARKSSGRRKSSHRRPKSTGQHLVLIANELAETKRGGRRRSGREPTRGTVPAWFSFGIGGLLGATAADVAHHWAVQSDPNASTPANNLPNGVDANTNNQYAADAKPTFTSIGIQFALVLLGIAGGGLAAGRRMNGLAMGLFGFGFGALFNLGRVLVTSYIIAPMFKGGSHAYLYQHELDAANALYPSSTSGTTGQPPRRMNPAAASVARTPQVLASRMGAPMLTSAPTSTAAQALSQIAALQAQSQQQGGGGGGTLPQGFPGGVGLKPPGSACCSACATGNPCGCQGGQPQPQPPTPQPTPTPKPGPDSSVASTQGAPPRNGYNPAMSVIIGGRFSPAA